MLDAGVPISVLEKASISEKWDICCCPKSRPEIGTGAQKAHRRAYLIG
jgi:hypothetical protein